LVTSTLTNSGGIKSLGFVKKYSRYSFFVLSRSVTLSFNAFSKLPSHSHSCAPSHLFSHHGAMISHSSFHNIDPIMLWLASQLVSSQETLHHRQNVPLFVLKWNQIILPFLQSCILVFNRGSAGFLYCVFQAYFSLQYNVHFCAEFFTM
jgi:hypothetical protein